MPRIYSAVLCGGLVSLAACREQYDIHNYSENLAQAVCGKAYDCCTVAEIEATEQGTYAHDRVACVDSMVSSLAYKQEQIQRGIEKNRVVYHADILKTCLENYAALSCDALKTRATSAADGCDGYLVPLVEDGDVCELDEECVSGNCQIPSENDGTGICQPFAGVGDPCANVTCGPSSYCGGSTCLATKADGESCTAHLQCETGGCNGYDPDTGQPGTCGLKGGPDSTCYLTKGCSAADPQAFAMLFMALLLWRRRRR